MMTEEELTGRISETGKYRDLCRDIVLREVREAAAKYGMKEAEKHARTRLHALTDAFITHDEMLRIRKLLPLSDDQEVFEKLLMLHASTRERMPLSSMREMYDKIFAVTGIPENVLDLGCGLNPVVLASMGIECTGIDANRALMECIDGFREKVHTYSADLMDPANVPAGPYDTVLVLKLIPLFETERRGLGKALLERADFRHAVVSYPTRSLGGQNRGMVEHYTRMMDDVLPQKAYIERSFVHGSELFFILGRK